MKLFKFQRTIMHFLKPLVVLISVLGVIGCKHESSVVPAQLCNFQFGPCQTLLSDGTNLEFSISPHIIQPLTDLEFEVRLANESVKIESVDVTLTMPAMSMPKNRIRLLPVGNGRFVGKGSIVRCLSGDRIWNSVIELNSAQSQKISADFQFEVEP